jgi:cysteine desulfurase/selenocysteine lyase
MTCNIEKARALFPITEHTVYFNHAGTGPMSTRAQAAIETCMKIYEQQAEFAVDEYFDRIHKARKGVADFIGASSEEITLTHNTSEGLYIALVNLPLKAGDTVLVMDEVFPAARYVVDNNVPSLKKVYVAFSGVDPVTVVKPYVQRGVRAVVVEYVQFLNGERLDLKRLASFLKNNGVFLIVDAIQAIGSFEVSVQDTDVDFLSCGSAKWLFGPGGAGFLYTNKRNFGTLNKLHTGWLGAEWKNFECFEKLPPLYSDSRMFELGTRNVIGISAMLENMLMLDEYGMQNVTCRIQLLKRKLRQAFEECGYSVLTPAYGAQSGIITVKPDNARVLFERLRKRNVVVSLRNDCLRFSPHFYNTEEEVDYIISVITE